MLGFRTLRDGVAVSGRDGRERVWDLSERVYPELPDVDEALAARRLAENRLRSLGIARARSVQQPGEPIDVVGGAMKRKWTACRDVGGWMPRHWTRSMRPRPLPRLCRRSIVLSLTAPVPRSPSASTTAWRCTSRP